MKVVPVSDLVSVNGGPDSGRLDVVVFDFDRTTQYTLINKIAAREKVIEVLHDSIKQHLPECSDSLLTNLGGDSNCVVLFGSNPDAVVDFVRSVKGDIDSKAIKIGTDESIYDPYPEKSNLTIAAGICSVNDFTKTELNLVIGLAHIARRKAKFRGGDSIELVDLTSPGEHRPAKIFKVFDSSGFAVINMLCSKDEEAKHEQRIVEEVLQRLFGEKFERKTETLENGAIFAVSDLNKEDATGLYSEVCAGLISKVPKGSGLESVRFLSLYSRRYGPNSTLLIGTAVHEYMDNLLLDSGALASFINFGSTPQVLQWEEFRYSVSTNIDDEISSLL